MAFVYFALNVASLLANIVGSSDVDMNHWIGPGAGQVFFGDLPMRKAIVPLLVVLGAGIGGVVGCDTSTPNSPAQQTALRDEATAALERMEAQDPTLTNAVSNAYGYAIFPEVGSAAVGIGGAEGKGFVYQNGNRIGQIKLTQASIGLQLGGNTFAELIIFQDAKAFNRVLNNSIEYGGDASATIVKAGAAGASQFSHGTQVYILPKGGFEAGISLNGQKFHYTALDNNTTSTETNTTTR